MAILTIRGNVGGLRMRLALAKAALGVNFSAAVIRTGQQLAEDLAAAAPIGASDGAPPGDAPGHLKDSFLSLPISATNATATISLVTTQPTKLRYVREGTGIYGPTGQPITPRTKRALYWPGAEHPVRSVRGMPPDDFVTPVLETAGEKLLAAVEEVMSTEVLPILGGAGGG